MAVAPVVWSVQGDNEGVAAFLPPARTMAASSARRVPADSGRWAYEPKLAGWRALCFTAAGVLQTRAGHGLIARFPEVVEAARTQCGDVVLDGELVAYKDGRLDLATLNYGYTRRRAERVTAFYVVFDVLAVGDTDVRGEPYARRRARLEELLADPVPPLQLMPSTTDRQEALEWMLAELATVGIEGIVAKPLSSLYLSGQRGEWVKASGSRCATRP